MIKTLAVLIASMMILILPGAYGQVTDSNEPNNEIGDSAEVQLNQAASGSIFPAGEVDFYKFFVNSSGRLQVQLDSIPKDMKGRIILYGKNFNFMGEKVAEETGKPVILKYDISAPSWYYIRISDDAGKSYNTGYSAQVSFEPIVDDEPNDEIGDATEVPINQSIDGFIFPAGEVDFYKFRLDSPGVLQATLSKVPMNMKGRIILYGKNFRS
jgi:hypothetical protein